MDSIVPPVAAGDEWLQEPDGFYNIKFGSTKEDAEKFVTFEQYGVSVERGGPPNAPYPARGVTHFSLGDADIMASLIFTPADGCHCFQGMFSTEQFENLKLAFVRLYGQPHEVSSEVRQFTEMEFKTYPPNRQHHESNVESLIWYSDKVYVSLVNRAKRLEGQFQIANYSFMRGCNGGGKMMEKAKRKLAPCSQEEYKPPDGWAQEPDDFNGLKLGMTKAEAESRVILGKCTVTTQEIPGFPTRENFLYETTLHVGGLEIPGEILFIEDRLINFGGKFDKSHWDAVKSAFIELYGRPHCDRREEMIVDRGALEVALYQRLDWHGGRVWIGLLDFPDAANFGRFYFQQNPTVGSDGKPKIGLSVSFKPVPQPPPPKIEVEHAASKLVLRLPDGTTLDYPRAEPLQIAFKASWHKNDDGRFVYELDLDASMFARIDIGDGHSPGGRAVSSEPEGWLWDQRGWQAWPTSDESGHVSRTARFSIASDMLPGSMPINLVRKDAQQSHAGWSITSPPWPIPVTLPRRLFDAVLKTLTQHAAFLNSTFIIGPAIAPNSTEADLRRVAQVWIDHYGFDFLKPALSGNGKLPTELDRLTPSTDFERQIVDCLRAAL